MTSVIALLVACTTSAPSAPAPAAPAPATPAATPAPVAAPVVIDAAKLSAFAALPAPDDPAATADQQAPAEALVALGRTLYYDARLSKNQDVSCNSCHILERYGTDEKPVPAGSPGQKGTRNAPSVYNAAGHFAQSWDGRAADVEAQVGAHLLKPVEMAMPDKAAVVKVLRSIPGYAPLFAAAFPKQKEPISFDNVTGAIGAFVRGLLTPAPFDMFLAGDPNALTAAQKQGLNTFIEVGCTDCHAGPWLGGASYRKAGLVKPWPDQKDAGRFEVTKKEEDRMVFKVPGLRNIEKTGPYMHDGSVNTLDGSIQTMGTHQLGLELTTAQVAEIRAFFSALTGPIPNTYIARPALPPDGPKTPKPDPG